MSSITPDASRQPTVGSDHPHAPPTDEEEVYYAGKPMLGGHPEKVLVLVLVGAFFLFAPALKRMLSDAWPPQWMTLVLLVTGICFWISAYILIKLVKYRISNYRIDYERGLFSRDISTLELWHVEDISFHQSLLDRILGIGTIRLHSHDVKMPDLNMRGLPDARKLFEGLKQRIIAVKRQSGVLKLDSGM